MYRRTDRQVLRLEELSESDFRAIMDSLPPPESAMFDHEDPPAAALGLGSDLDPETMAKSHTPEAEKTGR